MNEIKLVASELQERVHQIGYVYFAQEFYIHKGDQRNFGGCLYASTKEELQTIMTHLLKLNDERI